MGILRGNRGNLHGTDVTCHLIYIDKHLPGRDLINVRADLSCTNKAQLATTGKTCVINLTINRERLAPSSHDFLFHHLQFLFSSLVIFIRLREYFSRTNELNVTNIIM